MKFRACPDLIYKPWSLPVRGAWVEIFLLFASRRLKPSSLPVRGAWVEINSDKRELIEALCRSPCGERGLKYFPAFPA